MIAHQAAKDTRAITIYNFHKQTISVSDKREEKATNCVK